MTVRRKDPGCACEGIIYNHSCLWTAAFHGLESWTEGKGKSHLSPGSHSFSLPDMGAMWPGSSGSCLSGFPIHDDTLDL